MLKNKIFSQLVKTIARFFHDDFAQEYPPGFFIDAINESSQNYFYQQKGKNDKILEKIRMLKNKKMYFFCFSEFYHFILKNGSQILIKRNISPFFLLEQPPS